LKSRHFKRWLLGTLLALQLDLNVEATPPGRWVIQQFVRAYDEDPTKRMWEFFGGGALGVLEDLLPSGRFATPHIDDDNPRSKALLHSLYDDPRVIDAIIKWLGKVIK
jgi:hypothetical protein